MHAFEEVSRPVLFEDENSEFTYRGKGSCFLVSTPKHFYCVTAAHVIINAKANINDIRILPSDQSRMPLPFNQLYDVKRGVSDDEGFKDLHILRVDLPHYNKTGDSAMSALDIRTFCIGGKKLEPSDELWVIGYPAELTTIDYDAQKFRHNRTVLRGVFVGDSPLVNCYQISMETSIRLQSYDGLSGSPVYQKRCFYGDDTAYYCLVGMMLRGNAENKIGHFVDSTAILNLIDIAEAMPAH